MFEVIKRDWKPALFQGATVAFFVILFAIVAAFSLPDREANLLQDVRDAGRAQVCVLSLPIRDGEGRSLQKVNECLRMNNMEPITP